MARDCFIAGSGEREQASDSGDRAFDEVPVGAEERARSPHFLQGWSGQYPPSRGH